MKVLNRMTAGKLAQDISCLAVDALLEELHLTPKPGLVDMLNNGCHHDLTLSKMELSAFSLRECFHDMVLAGASKGPGHALRSQLAAIGRYGEEKMRKVTGNVNTHKGAIWAIGLIAGAAGVLLSQRSNKSLTRNDFLMMAGAIAGHKDQYAPFRETHGDKVRQKYLIRSAKEEAVACFPTIRKIALPIWDLFKHELDNIRKLNVLLALMSEVDDTCILYRSSIEVLREVKHRAKNIITEGGMGYDENWHHYDRLERFIHNNWVSPGGSADLLAATLFIQKIANHYKLK